MKKFLNYKYIAAFGAVIGVLLLFYLAYSVFDLHGIIYEPLDEKNGSSAEDKKENGSLNGEEDVDDIIDDSVLNVLLIGVDSDEGNARSDTIMLARYDSSTKEVGLVSIPRDTRVKLPGRGYERINHAYAYGGASYLKETLQDFLDINIHNYVRVNFDGFQNVVDIVGGVQMHVEQDMYYYDDALDEVIVDLDEGKQVLDGKDALGYVRWRGGADADIGRVQRQQKFLKEMANEVMRPGNVFKVRRLADEVADNVVMDFKISEILSLSTSFFQVNWDDMSTEVLDGESKVINGLWYYEVDKNEARETIDELI
ncbi:LCP family protein [Natranaerofaba carboxydovora]|uniref:LCP family protein n=1 Tax=Natranaerofaba carboxydovora TaxID=2742683 RepID=UPI001F134D19|nr:LCP family protein [Natranaerofaba carboxydovora]UMZ75084.1 Putative transcriptional regulator YwtF [Natranaerofaba carboxydovora]